jgi:hypothetical protein
MADSMELGCGFAAVTRLNPRAPTLPTGRWS